MNTGCPYPDSFMGQWIKVKNYNKIDYFTNAIPAIFWPHLHRRRA